MNLLNLDQASREAFVQTLDTLINKHDMPPSEMFMHVLESTEAPEMNYWMARVLIENHALDPHLSVATDQAGEAVKPLQAACLLQNLGVVAALLEKQAFSGSVVEREFQLAARIASKQEDQAVLGLLMHYAQQKGELDWMMQALHGSTLQ